MGNKVAKNRYFSKKTGKEVEIADPDFDVFFEKFSKKIDKEDSNTDVVFQSAVETMGVLLRNHPFFISEVKRIREKFDLPINGILSTQHLLWLSENEKREKAFCEAVRLLASKFNVPSEIKRSVVRFIQDRVLFDKKECFSSYKTELRLMTKEQIDEDPDSAEKVYLPITSTTSIREVKKYLGKLQKAQEARVIKRYGVPNIDLFGERMWQMYRNDLRTKEIKEILKKEYIEKKRVILTEEDVRRIRDRFKKALNTIRPIK